MTPIQLLLVDDHILFREGLGRLLTSEADFEVVGDCGTTSEACAIVERCTVDVILLDFDLAGTPASQCIPALLRAGYEGQILMVTAGMTADESSTALKLGASGVFLKHNSPSMLRQAIRLVAGGATWVDQRAMQLMARRADQPADMHGPELLTERAQRVLQGVFEGLGNKEIGARLGVSESAVKTTLQQLFRKTGVRTRSQLVRIALERSLATTPVPCPDSGEDVRQAPAKR
jgi:two-component system, NarL family, nitrate/nitrite response regulator NarL